MTTSRMIYGIRKTTDLKISEKEKIYSTLISSRTFNYFKSVVFVVFFSPNISPVKLIVSVRYKIKMVVKKREKWASNENLYIFIFPFEEDWRI